MADAATAHAASDQMEQIEDALMNLTALIQNQQHPVLPAWSLAESALDLDLGPGLFMHASATSTTSGVKSALWLNPLFIFDGHQTQGQVFIHSIQSYAQLLLEAFTESGEPSEEKVIQYAMSFMAKDSAQRWAKHMSTKLVFPFPTWEAFLKEFWLRFVKENEQDHVLLKLESQSYHMGSWDVFWYQ